MPPEAQTRLLRVLQDGEYLPVGARQPVKTNVRIIAATNQNLHHLMHEGLFREDLFYRLNVVPVCLPPLRDRVEDIGLLVNHFQLHAAHDNLPSKNFTPDALRALKSWHWPGNVRELDNVVQRALILHSNNIIEATDLLIENFEPDFVFYLSGVDIIEDDKLGKLSVSLLGCKERDRFLLDYCKHNKIPVQISMGGGYSPDINTIVEAHANTFRLAQEIFF